MQNNLTTPENVAAWLGSSTANDDRLLTRLIGSASRAIHAYLQRPNLLQHVCTETYDGSGGRRLLLRQWPVISVASLSIGGVSVPAAVSYGQSGYLLEPWDGYPPGRPQALDLCWYDFCRGLNNVSVNYTAGYAVQNEAQSVPASVTDPNPYVVTADAPYGTWAADLGVKYANNGSALTPVAANPLAGQYSVSKGKYIFNAADAGKGVLLSYSYIPGDIEQACIELVGERYRTRDRIGEKSKSLGGQETVSFSTAAMNDYVRGLLQPFRKSIPC